MFMSAIVRIFSFGERWNVLFNEAIAEYNTKIGYCFSNKNNLLKDHRPRNVLTNGIY